MTRATSQLDRSALKDFALLKILFMLVTRDTSHLERSALKDIA